MKTTRLVHRLRISAIFITALALAPLAQTQGSKAKERMGAGQGEAPSMQGMMDQCAKQCDSTMQKCDAVMGKLREARDSNDAAKMQAAIDETLKMRAEMKDMMSQCTEENRKACMEMMGMMGRMHGGMMMHSDGSANGREK